MLLLCSLALGLMFGLLLGGRITALGDLHLRGWPLLLAALLVQVLLFSFPFSQSPAVLAWGGIVYSGTLLTTLLVLFWNRSLPGMKLLLLGSLLNTLVIVANGGQMPVDQAKLARALGAPPAGQERGYYLNTSPMTGETRLPWLGDTLLVPEPLPMRNVFSVGDLLIAAGAAWIVAASMRKSPFPKTQLSPTPDSSPPEGRLPEKSCLPRGV